MKGIILRYSVIKKLSKNLSLPFTGIEQDWDLEMADSKRISDFLHFYKRKYLFNDEKYALMSLLLASYNDLLEEENINIDEQWNDIKKIIISEKNIYKDLLDYWSLDIDNKNIDEFKITPLVRDLKRTIYSEKIDS